MARDYTITQQGYSRTFTVTTGGGGGGDMLAATYDPTSVEGDAFSMDNMAEGADAKILTAAERAAITSNGNQLSNHSGRLSLVESVSGNNSFAVQVNASAITSNQTAINGKQDALTVSDTAPVITRRRRPMARQHTG